MNLIDELYKIEVSFKDFQKTSKDMDTYNKLYLGFVDEEKGLSGKKLINIIESYDRGNRDFGDNEVLMIALAHNGSLPAYKKELEKLKNQTSWFTKYGRAVRKLYSIVSYIDKKSEELMRYLGYNTEQLERIRKTYIDKKKKASDEDKMVASAIDRYINQGKKGK